ncbi:SURF1 family protein [Vibrio litoralis]|uniref:SURF1 family protein n=1 Tax=Vibrio litoralis TaxID=335972 RepID=UPI00041D82D0|nr:SURF1 family protein [Vibrio litoralis]
MSKWGIKKIGLLLLTVVVFAVMVKLGFWQLDRGNQKLAMEQQLQLRADANPVAIEDWQMSPSEEATGVKLSLRIAPLTDDVNVQRVYWDNQTWQGKVGYLVFQPVRLLANDPQSDFEVVGLIELGFIPAGRDRQVLPEVVGISQKQRSQAQASQTQTIVGRLYRKQDNPMSQGLMPEMMEITDGLGLRIQNLSLEDLSQHLFSDRSLSLFSYVIQPMQPLLFTGDSRLTENNGVKISEHLPHPWQPLPMQSKRHFGYAVQWFSMAAVLLGLAFWFAYRQGKPSKNLEKEKSRNQ